MKKFLRPITPNVFFEKFWEKKHLVIKRKNKGFYSDLFSTSEIDSLIFQFKLPFSDTLQLIKADGKKVLHRSIPTKGRNPDIFFIYKAYNDGYTVLLNEIESKLKPISILCKNLEEELQYRVGVNAYFTPANSQGFQIHYDTHDVFILQIDGSKIWKIYNSTVDLPLADTKHDTLKHIGSPLEEILLEQGDLLYIPRGVVHESLTSQNSSLHLTIGIYVIRWVDLFQEALVLEAEKNIILRKTVPPKLLNSTNNKELKNQINKLEIVLTDKKFNEIKYRINKRYFEHSNPPLDGHFVTMDKIKNIGKNTVVHRRPGMSCVVLRENKKSMIQFLGNQVSGPLSIYPTFNFIKNSKKFKVKDLPDSLTDNAKIVLIQRLVKEGLLSI